MTEGLEMNDSRPDGNKLWEELVGRQHDGSSSSTTMRDGGVDQFAQTTPELRNRMQNSAEIMAMGEDIPWFGQWLNGTQNDDGGLIVTSIDETDAENALALALTENQDLMDELIGIIGHPSGNLWEEDKIAKYLFSVARDEMRFIEISDTRHKEVYDEVAKRPGVAAAGTFVRMLRVAELELTLLVDTPGGKPKEYILVEEEGEGRPQHLIAETISPLADEEFRHYERCIEEPRFQAPENGIFATNWGCENYARSFHAMVRGLHEEVVRPLGNQEGVISDDEDELPTEMELELLRILLRRVMESRVHSEWPKNGSLVSGSLKNMISSYYVSTWEVRFRESDFEYSEDNMKEFATKLCDPKCRIEMQWSTGRGKTYFVWQEVKESEEIELALSGHMSDYDDLVTVCTIPQNNKGERYGKVVNEFDENWVDDSETITKEKHAELKVMLEKERGGIKVPFPGWFELKKTPIKKNEGDTKPSIVQGYCDEIRDYIECPDCKCSVGENCLSKAVMKVPKNSYNRTTRDKDGKTEYDKISEKDREVSICNKRFKKVHPQDSWHEIAYEKKKFIPSKNWIKARAEAMKPKGDDYKKAVNTDIKDMLTKSGIKAVSLKDGLVLPRVKPVIEGEGKKKRVRLEIEDRNNWVWQPICNHPFGKGYWPGFDITTYGEIAISTLESLSNIGIEDVVLRDDKNGSDEKRCAWALVSIKDWINVLKTLDVKYSKEQ